MNNKNEEYSLIITETIRELDNIMSTTPAQIVKNMIKKAMGRSVMEKDPFFWPTGMLMLGLVETYENSEDAGQKERILVAIDSHIKRWRTEYGGEIGFVDDALTGYCMVKLYDLTGKADYLKIADTINTFILEAPTDFTGSILYNPGKNSRNIFSDGIGQTTMFMAAYLRMKLQHENELLTENMDSNTHYYNGSNVMSGISKLYRQFINYNYFCLDNKSFLLYHGYSLDMSDKLKKNFQNGKLIKPEECLSEIVCERKGILGWGRAFGWMMLGLSESALLEEYLKSKTGNVRKWSKYDIIPCYKEMCKIALGYQREDGGFSWQMQAVEGHIDMSATGMIAYSIEKGYKAGVFGDDPEFENLVRTCLHKVKDCIYAHTENGIVGDALSSCDDFAVHYQTYGNYPWGQGACLAALSIGN